MNFSDLFDEIESPSFSVQSSQTAMTDAFSRLVYLLYSKKINLPSWLKYKLPGVDLPIALASPLIKSAYGKGSVYGEGDVEEIKQCLDQVLQHELEGYEEKQKFWAYLSSLSEGILEENKEIDFNAITKGDEFVKFNSGFYPFDFVTGGFYQSIVTIAGTPGSGKTSLCLTFLGELAKTFECWYFQTEIPASIIFNRLAIVKPVDAKGRIFIGNYSTDTILERVKKDPNPERIIIYDSPEITNTGIDKIQYFEKVYQDLVTIKQLCKMVIVTSQTKQGVSWEDLGVYSLSDSAAKGRYSDIIIYCSRYNDVVLIKTAKNRFGKLASTMINYDYKELRLTEGIEESLF